jgi:hypothetical protein
VIELVHRRTSFQEIRRLRPFAALIGHGQGHAHGHVQQADKRLWQADRFSTAC